MNENFDIMYSPPAPVGRPSKAYLAQKALRQQRRIGLLNLLSQDTQPPADDQQPTPNDTQTLPNVTQPPPDRYRNFTLTFKVHVGTYAETHSIRATVQYCYCE